MRALSLFIVFLLAAALALPAQTRKIAHRSHSGKPGTFALLLDDDNFGMYSPPRVKAGPPAKTIQPAKPKPVAPKLVGTPTMLDTLDQGSISIPNVESQDTTPKTSDESPTQQPQPSEDQPPGPKEKPSEGGLPFNEEAPQSHETMETGTSAVGTAPSRSSSTGLWLIFAFALFPGLPTALLVSVVAGKREA
jgi:hypothetical protein